MTTPAGSPPRRRTLVGAILIVLATLVAYTPAMTDGGFIWDDDDYVTDNRLLQAPDGLARIWQPGHTRQYYPAVFTTFWIEYQLWELNPRGYHVVNVLLHILNALLVWAVFARLRVPGAWLIGAIFALHPVHVESVAWITERKNVLSGFFYLAAALAYLKFQAVRDGEAFSDSRSLPGRGRGGGSSEQSTDSERSVRIRTVREDPDISPAPNPSLNQGAHAWGWYGASLLLFALALFSKTVTCSLPAALILADLWQRRRPTVRRLLPLAPMFALGLALALHTAHLERESVGAVGVDFDIPLFERVLIAARALLFYPWKLLLPAPLMFVYPRWSIDAGNVLDYLPLVIATAIAIASIWSYRRGRRGPALALAFYAGTVFPALGFFNVYPHRFSFVADHFVYLASLGLIAFVVAAARQLLRSNRLLYGAGGAVLAVFVVLAWVQGAVYKDAETVWRDTIAKNPDAWMPRSNLSALLLRQAGAARRAGGEAERFRQLVAEARGHAEAAIAAKPDHSTAHANLSEALRLQGDDEAALQAIDTAIDLVEQRFDAGAPPPRALATDYFSRGRLLAGLGRTDDAVAAFREAVAIDDTSIDAHEALARLLGQSERPADAIPHYEAVVARQPDNYYALMNLARITEREERYADAAGYYRRALMAARAETDRFQAAALVAQFLARCPDPAIREVEQAIGIAESLVTKTQRRVPGLLDVLASVYFEAGRTDDAIRTGEEAVELARRLELEDLAADIESRVESYREAEVVRP
ncbi:MAG: tetratricopeptide repeat protein [Planctomycetota bacterium]|jgi:tetratricopeptide (TPR) repeat protein